MSVSGCRCAYLLGGAYFADERCFFRGEAVFLTRALLSCKARKFPLAFFPVTALVCFGVTLEAIATDLFVLEAASAY